MAEMTAGWRAFLTAQLKAFDLVVWTVDLKDLRMEYRKVCLLVENLGDPTVAKTAD